MYVKKPRPVRSAARLLKNPFRGSCQRGRPPSDWIRIDRLCRSGGEFSALPKTFLQSFVRKDRRQTSFFDGLTAPRQERGRKGTPFAHPFLAILP